MDGVSLSKESCRFVEKEKSLYFDYISKALTSNQTTASVFLLVSALVFNKERTFRLY